MFEINNYIGEQSKAGINLIPIIALIVSIASIAFTFYNLFLSKRIEIINIKFQKLCISAIEDLFKTYDEKFREGFINLEETRKISTGIFVDVQVYITALKDIYKKIDVETIIKECEKFTDSLYQSEDFDIQDIKSRYLVAKLRIYQLLYSFALKHEMSLLTRIGFRK